MVVLALILRKLPGNQITNPVRSPLYARNGFSYGNLWTWNDKCNRCSSQSIHIGPAGQPMADINKVVKEATLFIAAYYCFKTPCSYMAEFRQQQWAYTIGTSTTATKLCSLPPTVVSFEQYFRRAHHQVAMWYSALSGDASAQNDVEYVWE